MPVDYGVIQVDGTGYRVVGRIDVLDDRRAAQAVLEIARGALSLARTMRRPVASITINWPGGSGVVKIKDREVVAVLIEERHSN